MIPYRYLGIGRLHFGFQVLVALALYWALFLTLNQWFYHGQISGPTHYVIGSFQLFLAFLIEFLTRLPEERRMSGLGRRRLAALSHRQMVFSMATVFGVIVMSKDQTISRLFLATFFASVSIWITWSNQVGFRMLHRMLYRTEEDGKGSAILVGSPPEIQSFVENGSAPDFPGLNFCGYINTGPGGAAIASIPELGAFDDLRRACAETGAKALVLLGLQNRGELVNPIVQLVDSFGLRATWIDNVESKFGHHFFPFHAGQYSIVSRMREPLEDPVNRFIKRTFDLFLALAAATLLLPPAFIFVWLLHRLNSPGPLLYRQQRTGRNGRSFEVYKFRSMYINPGAENRQTAKGDPRIFPGGTFIRKSSIDELPQLFNVIKGEMSIVGPRPHAHFTDDEHAENTPQYRLRSLAKPGITGLAQCKGYRGDTSLPRQIRNRIRLDVFYVQNWSLMLDLYIIVKTAMHLPKPHKSAY